MKILLVEDNAGDVRLILEALKDTPVPSQVSVASDGERALAFLRQEGDYADAARPDLILLDLNLPAMDGREALAAIKTDPSLKRIPVIILTSSQGAPDIEYAYALGANCYLLKPLELDEYYALLQSIIEFWGTHARLPMA